MTKPTRGMDPLANSAWSRPETVAGFTQSRPNAVLMRYATRMLPQAPTARVLDLGCGAGRNAIPLARSGWHVFGLDLSWPMLIAAASRARDEGVADRLHVLHGPMDALAVRSRSVDMVIAHGIWNLAQSAAEFRRALREAARVSTTGARLFVFTFSRHTLPPEAEPVAGESFVFTKFSGEPQCFFTDHQLVSELADAGFEPDPTVPLTEYNRPVAGALPTKTVPVVYEAAFRFAG